MRAVLLVALTFAGCYRPSEGVGSPCAANGACPGSQTCDRRQQPPVCVAELSDAGPPADMAIDGPPPACLTSDDCHPSAPVCDPSAKTCRGCVADAECTDGVCLEYLGQCVPSGAAIFVTPGGLDTGSCTRGQPCATLAFATQQLATNRQTIRVGDGSYASSGSSVLHLNNLGIGRVVVSGERASFTGADLTASSNGTSNPPVVQIENGADVVIEGLRIHDGGQDGIRNSGGLMLYRVDLDANAQHGLDSTPNSAGAVHIYETLVAGNGNIGISNNGQNGAIEVLRSFVIHNANGGISIQKSSATIVGSVIAHNGSATSNFGGVKLQNLNGLPQMILFDTIADNLDSGTNVAGVQADNGIAVAVDDCILTGNNGDAAPQICTACTATFSLFVGTAPLGSFSGEPRFVDPAADNYHLTSTSAARGEADPNASVRLDIDDEPRPQGPGFDIGADEIP